MKIKILVAIIISLIIICTGCANTDDNSYHNETSMFVEVESTNMFRVVYHKETKVMYTVSTGPRNSGNFTLLVNADGTPMTYKGE